jgi:hypothetical protein
MAAVDSDNSYYNITAAGTYQVKTGPGVLHSVTLNTPVAAATVKLYDVIVGVAGAISLCNIVIPASPQCLSFVYDVAYSQGLAAVVTGASDITISYK